MVPTPEDWLEKVLRGALAGPAQESAGSAADASPVPISAAWREELLARVARRSSDLLAQRIREHAEQTGWSLDDLAEQGRGCSNAARDFLRHGGDPQRLTPEGFARLFWCTGLAPSDWQDLLRQTVSAFATTPPSRSETIMRQTTGLSGSALPEALSGAGGGQRDPGQAVRTAELFVDRVMSEWRTLSSRSPRHRSVKERGAQGESLSDPWIVSTPETRRVAAADEVVRITMGEVMKVSADSKPKAVAGALAAVLREKGSVELQAIGAGAVNQAVKAIAITRGFVAPNGIDLFAIPAFTKVEIEGEERTAIHFLVKAR